MKQQIHSHKGKSNQPSPSLSTFHSLTTSFLAPVNSSSLAPPSGPLSSTFLNASTAPSVSSNTNSNNDFKKPFPVARSGLNPTPRKIIRNITMPTNKDSDPSPRTTIRHFTMETPDYANRTPDMSMNYLTSASPLGVTMPLNSSQLDNNNVSFESAMLR